MNSYIINQSQGDSPAEILLYGFIGSFQQNNTRNFVSDFKKLEAKNKIINVRVHSQGGSVTDGLCIHNCLKNSTSEIHVYIDGIAASIASVICMAASKIFMATNSHFMAHRIQTSITGDAHQIVATANLMLELESSLVNIYSKRTGIAEEEIQNNWMQTGKEKWFNAQQALEINLVDGIYDSEMASEKNLAIYNQKLKMENLSEFISFYNLKEDANIQDVLSCMQTANNEIENLKNEVKQLKQENEKFLALIEEENKNKITALIDSAIKDKKIMESQRAIYTALAQSNFTATQSAIQGIKTYVPISAQLSNSNSQVEEMSFEDYQKKNPKALMSIKRNEPEKYIALYEKQYGVKPNLSHL